MIDSNDTTVEWQKYTGEILILPVGALEQHDGHLPLNTDIVHAEYFSRMIAEDLDAALLPVQGIATSLEHSGFRGSFSLKPETLMQIIRDIADEAERQNFRILIVVNGHGGNYCLGPVCRDINRLDRKLKILLINPYEFRHGNINSNAKNTLLDIHAGKSETSVMMMENPEAVREIKGVPELDNGNIPLRQSDLTTFGTGHFNADGAIGHYELASKEEGELLTENTVRCMLPYIRDRISRIRNQPRFAGAGGLVIRNMIAKDVPELLKLTEQADWNQTTDDWKAFLDLDEKGCFVMVHMGKPVASVIAIGYENKLAWIGMVLVDREFKRMGIASKLMKHALEFIQNYKTIKLDATPAGKRIYDKLDFKDEYSLTRMINNSIKAENAIPGGVSTITIDDLPEIIAKDKAVFGADRTDVLKYLFSTFPELCFKHAKEQKIIGYSFGRRGRKFTQIGPLVADDCATAAELLCGELVVLNGEAAIIDVIDANSSFISCLNNLGFIPQRHFTRMYNGENLYSVRCEQYFAIAGPELG